jgi:predicted flap endonuclease-1-like 5' DNA nuclease
VQRYDTLLEDFRGRIERDDWINGAQQEHQKKYGEQL